MKQGLRCTLVLQIKHPMDAAHDAAKFSRKSSRELSKPIRLAGSALGTRAHICAFFNDPEDGYRVLLPFVQDGFERGEKIVHAIDPERRAEHLGRLATGGIDVNTLLLDGRFELRTSSDTHLLVDDEVGRLKACVNDLISVLALPAVWTDLEPRQIIKALLDALMGILRLDVVYAELKDPAGDAPVEVVRYALPEHSTFVRLDISRALNNCLKEDFHSSPPVLKGSTGELSIVPLRLGLRNELGWVLAASRRADFPTETERLLLNVAANQAATGCKRHGSYRSKRGGFRNI
jgi:MEDS: MEthanogen/methylotroph, DcmR Sensory domain